MNRFFSKQCCSRVRRSSSSDQKRNLRITLQRSLRTAFSSTLFDAIAIAHRKQKKSCIHLIGQRRKEQQKVNMMPIGNHTSSQPQLPQNPLRHILIRPRPALDLLELDPMQTQ